MADLLPFRPAVTNYEPNEPVVLDLASDHADRVFKALSSEMARRILQTLYDEPRVASDIADELDTSLQNVDYHLRNLRDAELVEIVDTWYSQTGNEMKVYAPTGQAVMILSDPDQASRMRTAASAIMASLLFVGVIAALFRFLVVDWLVSSQPARSGDSTEGPAMETEGAISQIDALSHLPPALDPGIVFVAGALVALIAVGLFWLLRERTVAQSD